LIFNHSVQRAPHYVAQQNLAFFCPRTRTDDKDYPRPRAVQLPFTGNNIVAFPQVGGLHHRYELPPAPESDSDFRLAPGSFTKLENLILNHRFRLTN
jgi:hypothetical protein